MFKDSRTNVQKLTIRKMWRYFKTLCLHKWYVLQFCFQNHLYWQGIIHDLSKFAPSEFFMNARHYNGKNSPIDTLKQLDPYSISYPSSWLHHKGRNKHHPEYWVDRRHNGFYIIQMPYKYALEMICDWEAASKAYSPIHQVTPQILQDWFNKRMEEGFALHPQTIKFVTKMLKVMVESNSLIISISMSKELYDQTNREYWLEECQTNDNYYVPMLQTKENDK